MNTLHLVTVAPLPGNGPARLAPEVHTRPQADNAPTDPALRAAKANPCKPGEPAPTGTKGKAKKAAPVDSLTRAALCVVEVHGREAVKLILKNAGFNKLADVQTTQATATMRRRLYAALHENGLMWRGGSNDEFQTITNMEIEELRAASQMVEKKILEADDDPMPTLYGVSARRWATAFTSEICRREHGYANS